VTPCILVEVDKHLEGSHCHHLGKSQGTSNFSENLVTVFQILKPSISQGEYPENRGIKWLRNIDKFIPNYIS
jgi:hypothetical protein